MATEAKKYMHDSESFPILFENGEVVIYTNPSKEIFIKGKKGGNMRMNFDDGIQFTTHGCRVDPFYTNGLIGCWRVK